MPSKPPNPPQTHGLDASSMGPKAAGALEEPSAKQGSSTEDISSNSKPSDTVGEPTHVNTQKPNLSPTADTKEGTEATNAQAPGQARLPTSSTSMATSSTPGGANPLTASESNDSEPTSTPVVQGSTTNLPAPVDNTTSPSETAITFPSPDGHTNTVTGLTQDTSRESIDVQDNQPPLRVTNAIQIDDINKCVRNVPECAGFEVNTVEISEIKRKDVEAMGLANSNIKKIKLDKSNQKLLDINSANADSSLQPVLQKPESNWNTKKIQKHYKQLAKAMAKKRLLPAYILTGFY
ncbi:hypothetical protein ONZ45_g15397 [Pleurotus djamor]|nr:hypothetical protein ONZ45_g15397 [Pleurotus djamor]